MLLVWFAVPVFAQPRSPLIGGGAKHVTATLAPTAERGTTAQMLLMLDVTPGWHISWRNPGETGLATRLSWALPAGVRAGAELWPVPTVERTDVGVTHIMSGRVPWVLSLESDSVASTDRLVGLTIRVGVCRDVCIPESVTVQGVLPGRGSTTPLVPVPPDAQGRLARAGGVLPVRRLAGGVVCLDRVPSSDGTGGVTLIVAGGSGLEAGLPVRMSSPTGAGMVTVPERAVLPSTVEALLVQGRSGTVVQLSQTAAAPRCRGR